MNLNELRDKKIKLYGKTRSLSQNEFEMQLATHNIELSNNLHDVVVTLEGRMVNPIEQNELDQIYKEKIVAIIDVDVIEKQLISHIDEKKLLMSLKLSNNQERLLDFLTNRGISNALFLKLISLFDWKKESFFENDENRNVTAALISRFYENIEQNHNVQYANMGLLHLLSQSDSAELIGVVASLEPLRLALKSGCDNSTMKILELIAIHPQTDAKILKQFTKSSQKNLHKLLARNSSLPSSLLEYLSEYDAIIAQNITLDDTLFEKYFYSYPKSLAQNSSLSEGMQDKLAAHYRYEIDVLEVIARFTTTVTLIETLHKYASDIRIHKALALNSKVPAYILKKYYENAEYHISLAANSATPLEILEKFSQGSDATILLELAKNSATPVNTLYQLQLDRRFERAVKENEAFGRYIKSNNLGWEV